MDPGAFRPDGRAGVGSGKNSVEKPPWAALVAAAQGGFLLAPKKKIRYNISYRIPLFFPVEEI